MNLKDKDTLIVNANYLDDSLSALRTLLDYKLGTDMTVDDVDQINSVVVAIQTLAKKHAEDMEHIQFEN